MARKLTVVEDLTWLRHSLSGVKQRAVIARTIRAYKSNQTALTHKGDEVRRLHAYIVTHYGYAAVCDAYKWDPDNYGLVSNCHQKISHRLLSVWRERMNILDDGMHLDERDERVRRSSEYKNWADRLRSNHNRINELAPDAQWFIAGNGYSLKLANGACLHWTHKQRTKLHGQSHAGAAW